MAKTAVISWRIKPELRRALEEKARERGLSLPALLEEICTQFLRRASAIAGNDESNPTRIPERA